jgi:ubiquinone/menaquinone biosynthesis C-methylase UbiE
VKSTAKAAGISMQSLASKTSADLFLEEGTAFALLEGRHLFTPRKDENMSSAAEETSDDQHFAPREAWDAIAESYDEYVAPGEAGLATEALRLAGLKPEDSFLDVAAGTGGLTLPAARLGARVIAADWSPKMIERFQARARDEGIRDARGKVMDCHALAFEDGTFDVTGSMFGVMLVPKQPTALREMVRVTKAGGRVLVIGYGSPAGFEALQVFIGALREVNPDFEGLPSEPPPLEFQVSNPETLRARLADAGLRNVTVDTAHQERIDVRSGDDLWNWCLGGNPIPGMLVADLTREQRSSVRERLDRVVRDRSNGSGRAVFTAPINIAIGMK